MGINETSKTGNPYGGVSFLRTPDHNPINLAKIFSKYDPEICREIIPYFEKAEILGDPAAGLFQGIAYLDVDRDGDKAASYLNKYQRRFNLSIIESTSYSAGCDAIEINRSIDSAKALGRALSYYRIPNHLNYSCFFMGSKKKFLLQLERCNSAPAECLLGMIYQNESAVFDMAQAKKVNLSQSNKLAGFSNENDSKEAVKYFNASALRGFVPSMLLLACSFQQGIGVDKDSAKAEEWLKRAAALRSPNN